MAYGNFPQPSVAALNFFLSSLRHFGEYFTFSLVSQCNLSSKSFGNLGILLDLILVETNEEKSSAESLMAVLQF